MTGIFDNGPIPPEALSDEDHDWLSTWAAKRMFHKRRMPADGIVEQSTWGPDFNMRSVLIPQSGDVGKRIFIDKNGVLKLIHSGEVRRDAIAEDLDAKAAAFREDMIERVTRKGPEGAPLEYHSITTLNKIRASGACEPGWKKLLKYLGKTAADDEPLSLLTVLDSNGLDDALWVLSYGAPECERFARHFQASCAEQVLPIFESERPADMRVREQIAMLRNDEANAEERAAARAAARAATWDAARAASAAAVRADQEAEFRRMLSARRTA